jgi:kynurenine formamidase
MNTDEYKIIDLTHTLSSDIPSWDGSCGFEIAIATDYSDCTTLDLFRIQKINMKAGMGTHMDAPAHCFPDSETIDAIPLEQLIVDCVVIDVSNKADEKYQITPLDIEVFEKDYGDIKSNTFVIFYTGWDSRWGNTEMYINDHKFPSIHEDTAKVLLKRGVSGVGIDTLSADTGTDGFPVHRAILGTHKYLVENVANAKSLPPTGFKVGIFPIKIGGGTEAPIRLVGFVWTKNELKC